MHNEMLRLRQEVCALRAKIQMQEVSVFVIMAILPVGNLHSALFRLPALHLGTRRT